jgi:probable phosphoglycerate mutase
MAASKARSRNAAVPKPTTVFLVRHGKTPTTGAVLPGRAKGLHLSEDGRLQAQQAADRLAALGPETFAAVYASPMERTRQTASPIARALGRRVRVRAGLIEAEFGDWTGRKLSELSKLPEWTTVQRYPSGFRFPGGESFAEMQLRITGALHRIVADHPGQRVVAVSHADPIKAAVADALGTHLDQFQRIVVGPCSISVILFAHDGPRVLAVNSMGSDLSTLVAS